MDSAIILYMNIVLTGTCLILLFILIKKGNSHTADITKEDMNRLEDMVRKEIANNRAEISNGLKDGRTEMSSSISTFQKSLLDQTSQNFATQSKQLQIFSDQLNTLTKSNEERLDKLHGIVDTKMSAIQSDNNKKLDEMRKVVDEKLESTLEKRLGESFKLVSDRLEQVHKGLGEMQNLAIGVGDLKKVLTNIKSRGTWGEVQLQALLDNFMTTDQYAKNVSMKKGSKETVEFAIKLPGKDEKDKMVYLPIDAKFPKEDYERLLEAQERADVDSIESFSKALETTVKNEAKKINSKYIDPPNTTDFAILFIPIEGLYAEIIRRPGVYESIQREYRVMIASPTTLSAILNSLQMGFRTLAIEKRSSEVWELLSVVQSEFGKFGDILEKTQKKLKEASTSIDTASKKSRTIEKKLKNVERLPVSSKEHNLLLDTQFDDEELEN